MTQRNRRDAASRADARRRARYRAQGRDDEVQEEDLDEGTDADRGSRPAGGSFLTRLFPPAAPLPGKPDPLADFHYRGPFAGVASGIYLLYRSPMAWLLPAAGWIVGRLITAMTVGIVQLVATIATFMTLLVAGWMGWPRPWLFGLAAAVVGSLAYSVVWASWVHQIPELAAQYSAPQLFLIFTFQETFQWLFGLMGGWYGGYLRRRSAAPQPTQRRRR